LGELSVSKNHLENSHLRVNLNDNGDIVSIFDKQHGRELLPDGEIANEFQLFEDRPLVPDAWDIDIFYDDKMWKAEKASSVVVKENGPLRGAVEVRRKLFSSELVQRIILHHDSPILGFNTEIDWKERKTLLKVAFPVDVLSPFASYEIQWGHVQRPTHTNTSWDWARFESCAQKWVDLSEGGFGVTLINDCKYGHDIHGNVIRLSLLRGTTDPDPQADLGHHEFSYALLPHTGPLSESTLSAAYAFNDPLFSYMNKQYEPGGEYTNLPWVGEPFIRCSSENVIVETIKRAEDGNGIIIRLYESLRKRGMVNVECMLPLETVWLTDLLESVGERIETDGRCFDLHFMPFEIITVRLVPAAAEA
jgi:alpha-mannosidase